MLHHLQLTRSYTVTANQHPSLCMSNYIQLHCLDGFVYSDRAKVETFRLQNDLVVACSHETASALMSFLSTSLWS